MINQLKTILLLGLLTALMLWLGNQFGGTAGLTIALIFALLLNFGSFWFSDKIVLAMYRATPASKEQYPSLHKIVDELTSQFSIPKPKLFIVSSDNPNAFATGRSPKHAAVACTTGILKLLNDKELKGVLAHELSHVTNRDILVTTIAATIAAVISYIAMMAQWAAIFGGFGRDRNNNFIQLLALAILTPILATILQLAISRSREYLADSTGAATTKDSESLASALEKISSGVKSHPMRMGSQATSSLFFANPFRAGSVVNLLSTHPPIDKRVARLRSMKF